MSLLIDAREGHDVATTHVVGAYLLVNMKDYVLLRLTGDTVNMMCQINPKYLSYVTQEGGKQVLYMRLKKGLYGCMHSAILWYINFQNCLEHLGFKLNPYDPCVANKTVNREQCKKCWYIDDIKISHVDPKIVDWIIENIEKKFGKMAVKREKQHTFVGMDIVFIEKKTV